MEEMDQQMLPEDSDFYSTLFEVSLELIFTSISFSIIT